MTAGEFWAVHEEEKPEDCVMVHDTDIKPKMILYKSYCHSL